MNFDWLMMAGTAGCTGGGDCAGGGGSGSLVSSGMGSGLGDGACGLGICIGRLSGVLRLGENPPMKS